MKKFPARVSINRRGGNMDDSNITLSITDEASGIQFAVVEMTLEDFAFALTGVTDMKGKGILRGEHFVGKVKEIKKELVEVPTSISKYNTPKEDIQKILEPYEVDGWKGRLDDVTNHHNTNSVIHDDKGCIIASIQEVTFFRYVDKKDS